MRTKIGIVLLFLGGFLLIIALMGQLWAPGQVKRTPLDSDAVTQLAGRALLNGPDGVESFPVKVISTTKADSAKSDGDVIVFQNSQCVVRDEGGIKGCVSNDDPEKRLITASVDSFATNRKTAVAVNDAKYLSSSAGKHEGLINKFPFNAQKKTYPFWDGTTGKAVPAEFYRTATLDGLDVYVYRVTIDKQPIQIAEGVDGLYSDKQLIYVEPETGAFIKVENTVTRTLTDGTPFLYLDVAYTDAQVQTSVDDTEASLDKIHLITKTVPIIGYIVGGLMLIGGAALILLDDRRRTATRSSGSRAAGTTATA